MRIPLLALALAALALPAPALAQQDPGDLACMAQAYSTDQLAEIAQLENEFTLDEGSNVSERMGNLVSQVALDCFLAREWSENATYNAVLYEMGRLSESAYRKSGALSQENIGKIDAALAKGGHEDLWSLLERGVVAGVDGTEPQYTTREQFAMGLFVMSAGIPSGDDVVAERIGVLLGFMALQRYAIREFNLAEGGR